MNEQLVAALAPILFEDGDFSLYGLTQIPGWPQINYDDGEEVIVEPLDLENCGVIGFTATTLTICGGGDWQEPHTVVVALVDGQLMIESCEASEYDDNDEMYRQVQAFFNGVEVAPGPAHPEVRTATDIRREMQRAISIEDYERAAELRDELAAME